MNRKDREWVEECLSDYLKRFRDTVDALIDRAIAAHRSQHHSAAPPREPIIGACALCGGAVVVGRAGGASVLYGERHFIGLATPHDLPRCLKCGAEAANVIPMKERRKDDREEQG